MVLDLLDQILPHLQNSIYPVSLPLTTWKVKEGDIENAHSPSLREQSWGNIQVPTRWGGYNRTVWFRTTVVVPPEFAGRTIGIVLDFPEALLYLNGTPHQGIDQNHQEVIFSTNPRAGEKLHLAVQAYSGRKTEQNNFSRAELVAIDTTARALYNQLCLLRELDKLAGVGSHESKDIRELIRRILIYVKYYRPGSEEYPNAIARAYNFLSATLGNEFQSTSPGLIHFIGQSHLDIAWLWTLTETRRKAARTFSTALRLMEEFPDFKFTQSQAQLYELVRDSYPALYRQIRERVAEGRWEIAGSSWVESDCNLPGGESLIRQILFGKRFFKQEFGVDRNIMWLPDTFGFPASLPQILKKSGITFFYMTKLNWNEKTKFPYNSFWWEGIDGSKVLSHMPPSELEAQLHPSSITKSWNAYQQKEILNQLAQTFGHGDGGGGPTKEQLDTVGVLSNIVSLPQSRSSIPSTFFQALAEHQADLPTWSEELYLEKHRGTFTTQAWIKKENRECETLLFNAELLSVLASMVNNGISARNYPSKQLDAAWKKLLLNQSHNILPGSSISAVYDEARKDFVEIRQLAGNVITRSTRNILKPGGKSARPTTSFRRAKRHRFSLFNPSPWSRTEYVTINLKSKAKGFVVTNDRGETVEHQIVAKSRSSVSLLCYISEILPMSWFGLHVTPLDHVTPNADPWVLTPKKVETPFYRAHLNKRGQFTSLHDKRTRRDLIRTGSVGNHFQTFVDKPKQWDAWEIDQESLSRKTELFKTKSVKVVETGPLRATLRLELKSQNGSLIAQDIRFYHATPRIDFETTARWSEKQILLKVAFGLNVKTNVATFEIPFGVIRRQTKPRAAQDIAKFEVPAQQWADLSDPKFGVSLLNNCKYGHDAKQTTLRLTLIRSPFYPHPTEPWHFNDTKVTDQGHHSFSYALLPHTADWKKGETVHRAREFNNPVLVFDGEPKIELLPFLKISHPAIQLDAVKKSETDDTVILRLHDAHGDGAKTTVEFGHHLLGAVECDMMENELQKLKPSKSKLQLAFKPFEIKTVKVRLKPRVRKRKV